MSYTVRDALPAALADVDGVKGYARMPKVPKPGDVWLKWMGGEAVAPQLFQDTWQLQVMLPSDVSAHDDWIIEHVDAIIEATAHLVFVFNRGPGSVGELPALMLDCRE